MSLRSALVAAAVVAAGSIVAVPTAANAASEPILHISCRSNKNHYTAADLYFFDTDYFNVDKIKWNTDAPFRPDRITWAGYLNGAWHVIASEGVTSDPADVEPTGWDTSVGWFNGPAYPNTWRMTVFDKAQGDCQQAIDAPPPFPPN